MDILGEISDGPVTPEDSWTLRKAARAVCFDKENKIPLLYVSTMHYHKLPGGEIEQGEEYLDALIREVKEETGCEMQLLRELGIINEYRARDMLHQVSYCYLGMITQKGEPQFTDLEREKGLQLEWRDLEDAIQAMSHDQPRGYSSKFIHSRDLLFLQKTKALLLNHKNLSN